MTAPNEMLDPPPSGDIFYGTRVMLFITLLCLGYLVSRPDRGKAERYLLQVDSTGANQPRDRGELAPWQKNASEKAVQGYAAAQEKKWRNWNAAMFDMEDGCRRW